MKRGLLFTLALLVGIGVTLSAWSYYSFVRGGKRTSWPESAFTTDHNGEIFQSVDLSAMNVGVAPNNDTVGLLLVADAKVKLSNCTDGGGSFGPPSQPEYAAVFNAMATWDILPTTTVNLAFVCATDDITVSSFDNIADLGSNDLEIWRGGFPIFNGFNEIAFDDSSTGDMIDYLNIGIDKCSLLGLTFPFDTNHNIVTSSNANGTISEAFMIINESGQSPCSAGCGSCLPPNPPPPDLQGVITHEIGHLLGLGHTTAILNVVDGNDSLVPTMYFSAIDNSVETRTLEIDDIAGITMSYPAPGEPDASFGSIIGQVLSPTGLPLTGSSIIAQDVSGQEIAVIAGGEPNLISSLYRLEAVPPGSYHVRVTPMDGSSAAGAVNTSSTGSIDNIFFTPSLSFAPEFWDHASDESSATTVTVSAGSTQSNINFGSANANPGGLFGDILDDPNGCQAGAAPLTGASWIWSLLAPLAFLGWRRRRCP